ncbi:MAG: 2-alkenal reductase [Parcubacteria group bacterium GW2011_GWD1_42_9]|nr:MAG: 2-alkenal reductase [Parcubacteria group bacterium GW2011_GWD1_42_9]KKT14258.1 MAG: 2-alkenal reductase [Parcubacteria group bacterium GW2011_GWA1_43_27]HCM45843.1 hypothetical protein [Candidatus Veblenbacteria bacterium]
MIPSPPATEYEKEIRALYRERNERTFGHEPKPPKKSHRWLDFIVLLILISVFSITSSLVIYLWFIPQFSLQFAEQNSHTVVAQPELADDFTKQLIGSSATVFAARSIKAGASLAEQSYLSSEALGQAFVLSSDGWLVTTQAVVSNTKGNYVVVPADGRVYQATAVALDPVAPLAYLKIEVRNLTAIPFASQEDILVNSPVLALTGEIQGSARSWYLRYLANVATRTPLATRAELPTSSETLPDRFILDQALPAGSKGAPVINMEGKVVGLVADYGGSLRGLVPLINLLPAMDTLFSEQKVRRPLFGATYIQTDWLVTTEPINSSGAILVSNAKRAAVVSKSPAAAAGLKEGDKILSVAGEKFSYSSLSLVLQRYRPGDVIELTIERAGKEQVVKVTLGEIAGEYYNAETK